MRRRGLMGASGRRLPSQYQEVEYIGNKSRCYINTNMIVNDRSRAVLICAFPTEYFYEPQETYPSIFGSQNTYDPTHGTFLSGYASDTHLVDATIDYPHNVSPTYQPSPDEILTIELSYQEAKINDIAKPVVKFNVMTRPMFLFTRDSSTDHIGKLVIYAYVLYEGNTVVQNLVPCVRKSDNKPGMYDLCGSICPLTGTPFYINANTSATEDFIVGPDVN